MLSLALNLSVPNYGVGIHSPKGRLTLEFSNDFARTESLIDDIDQLLSRHGYTLKDIQKIGVVQGPGSYTGTRIACTLANTLNQVNQTPLIGFSSLELLAHQSITSRGIFIMSLPRTKYDVNAALFSSDGRSIHRMTQDFTWPLESMLKKCHQFKEPISIIGQGYESIQDQLLSSGVISCHPKALTIDAILTHTQKVAATQKLTLPIYSEPRV